MTDRETQSFHEARDQPEPNAPGAQGKRLVPSVFAMTAPAESRQRVSDREVTKIIEKGYDGGYSYLSEGLACDLRDARATIAEQAATIARLDVERDERGAERGVERGKERREERSLHQDGRQARCSDRGSRTMTDHETDAAFVERVNGMRPTRFYYEGGGHQSVSIRTADLLRLIALARLAVTQPAAAPDAGGNQEDEDGPHRTHVLRASDASSYDLVCISNAAWRDVLAERRRQAEAEGWTPEHDDAHTNGELADAASCYAKRSSEGLDSMNRVPPRLWPWEKESWRPGIPRRMLEKAGALILAEIERLDRAVLRAGSEGGK